MKGQPDEYGTGRIGNSHINTGENANLGLLPAIYPPLDPPPYPPPVASKDLVPDSPLLPPEEEGGKGGTSLGLRPCEQGKNSETPTPNENLALNTDLARTRNKENLGGRLVEIYAKQNLGVLNMAGFKKVQALDGTVDEKCKTFECWLRRRKIEGLNCPLAMFAIEYATYSDDLKRYQKHKAAVAANQKKIAESHAAIAQWQRDLDSIKPEGNPSTWPQRIQAWPEANPCPLHFVMTNDGELATIDWGAKRLVDLHVSHAMEQGEEYLRRTAHVPDDFFCMCERCQPQNRTNKEDRDLDLDDGESAALHAGEPTADVPKLELPTVQPPEPAEVLTGWNSALEQFRDQLQPFNDLLVEVASYKGVPLTWSDAVPFLDCVIDGDIPHEELAPLIAVRDEIKSRIPTSGLFG